MTASPLALRALLGHAIDYAGVFPPARLPLERAARNYARYREEKESWLLGRFVCPAARLAELAPLAGELFPAPPVPLAVIASPAAAEAPEKAVAEDLGALREFDAAAAGRAVPDLFETRVPDGIGGEDDFREHFRAVMTAVDAGSPVPIPVFFEVGGGTGSVERFEQAACALALVNLERRESAGPRRYRPGGLKMRCGGISPEDFPSVEAVSRAIAACRDAGVPFKATAGLHRPLRHRRADLNVKAHGFLNLFAAAAFAVSAGLGAAEIGSILAEEDPAAFAAERDALLWRGRRLDVESIAAARRRFLSFGSCSFDEPREGLRELGLI
ncbi:MAG: hypothetical protein D6718_12750 [Acidobacteria bacterium]|nr:MAG: hypothetical protein D6718_12750 [Acidobacteriota bacterium]